MSLQTAHRRTSNPVPASRRQRSPAYTIALYLVPGFPMMAFASAIEPLRAANRLADALLFRWRLLSIDGAPVRASNGIDVAVHGKCGDDPQADLLLVCAGTSDASDPVVVDWLRRLGRAGVALGGISLGAWPLAQAGLLDGRRVALHWESLAAFAERFPRIRTTADLFVLDGNRATCSGGTAALDMMLQLVTERAGRALANDVSEQFIHPRIRGGQDPQRMAAQSRLGVANDKLIAALDVMETQSEEPRPVRRIAADVGLSPRQLERLFAKYLRESPSRHYLKLRLARARTMLTQTTKPVLDVAVACGFASASHFSRCYRAEYGHKPSDERHGALVQPPSKPARRKSTRLRRRR